MTDDVELTEAEELELIRKDPVAALCYFVKKSGATMTLYGVPVDEKQLRGHAEAIVDDKIEAAAISFVRKDSHMTDREKVAFLTHRISTAVTFACETLNPESGEINGNNRISATRQLKQLLKLAQELDGQD